MKEMNGEDLTGRGLFCIRDFGNYSIWNRAGEHGLSVCNV
jgi:hypothetical protein